jgi:hypothetical protein
MQVQNRHTHPGVPRRTAVTICGPANAEAGSAIVALYKSLWQLGHPRAHTLYQSVVHAELLALLESPIPHCQDAGGLLLFSASFFSWKTLRPSGACFNFLLNMDCLSEQQKLELLVHSYQNNYGCIFCTCDAAICRLLPLPLAVTAPWPNQIPETGTLC